MVLSHVQQLVSRSQTQQTELELLKQLLKSHSTECNAATELIHKALQQTGSPSMLDGVSREPSRASVTSSYSHSVPLDSEPTNLTLHPSVSVHQSPSISLHPQPPSISPHSPANGLTAQRGHQAQRFTEHCSIAAERVSGNSNAASLSPAPTSTYACQGASQDLQDMVQASLSSVAQAAAEHIKHASNRLQDQDDQMRQLCEQLRVSVSRTAESEACQSKLLQQLQDTRQSLRQVSGQGLKPMHCFTS